MTLTTAEQRTIANAYEGYHEYRDAGQTHTSAKTNVFYDLSAFPRLQAYWQATCFADVTDDRSETTRTF